jgi:6-pyruvoyltetrahydropterin/6-carboxytetrahydropterin synthase
MKKSESEAFAGYTTEYAVKITKEEIVFSAAHFITFNGNICERLHGHNYRVAAEVVGPLDENQYVFDFIALRDTLKTITSQLDHHVLLPTKHAAIRVTENDREVEAKFEDRRWVFPKEDCILLPVENTTAELLANYIGQQLLHRLTAENKPLPKTLRISVDECQNQWATCEFKL